MPFRRWTPYPRGDAAPTRARARLVIWYSNLNATSFLECATRRQQWAIPRATFRPAARSRVTEPPNISLERRAVPRSSPRCLAKADVQRPRSRVRAPGWKRSMSMGRTGTVCMKTSLVRFSTLTVGIRKSTVSMFVLRFHPRARTRGHGLHTFAFAIHLGLALGNALLSRVIFEGSVTLDLVAG